MGRDHPTVGGWTVIDHRGHGLEQKGGSREKKNGRHLALMREVADDFVENLNLLSST